MDHEQLITNMSKSPINRLKPLWPSESTGPYAASLPPVNAISQQVEPWIRNLEIAIVEHPRASLTAAATFGAVLGWIVKQR